MDTGVHDQPRGAHQFRRQRAELAVGIRVQAEVVAERDGIQRPAFDERGLAAEMAEARQVRRLLRQRDLVVTTRERPR